MGSDLHVVTWATGAAAERLADLAVTRIEILEQCWSRFRPDSELNRLNSAAGCGPVTVSEDMHRLVHTLIRAWEWSEGDVDATVLGGMVSLGYDEDFAVVAALSPLHRGAVTPAPGMHHVVLGADSVALPAGTGLDPGAVGKGLAGDIATAELAAAGAHAVLIGIGGDVVTHGTPPDSDHWRVSMRDDRHPRCDEVRVVELAGDQRAVATSSVLRRRWADHHHVLVPGTGRPTDGDVVQATVVADRGWRAEAAATLALVRGGDGAAWLAARGCTAYLLGREASHA